MEVQPAPPPASSEGEAQPAAPQQTVIIQPAQQGVVYARQNYLVKGKMTQGFAFLAYPATYRASGVMTVTINQSGVIVQKDLGGDTAKKANKITEYNPDKSWDEVDD